MPRQGKHDLGRFAASKSLSLRDNIASEFIVFLENFVKIIPRKSILACQMLLSPRSPGNTETTMNSTVHQIQIADDPEAGSALALLYAAAGFDVETDFHDGSVFISAQELDRELQLPVDQFHANDLARQLRLRMDELAEEAEWAELGNEFHKVG
jgi:hypothetical protein